MRAQVIFSTYAVREALSFANRVQLRIEGELYDAVSRQFVGAWEAPRQTFPAPADCNDVCLSEIIGDHASEIAASVGKVSAIIFEVNTATKEQAKGLEQINSAVTQLDQPRKAFLL